MPGVDRSFDLSNPRLEIGALPDRYRRTDGRERSNAAIALIRHDYRILVPRCREKRAVHPMAVRPAERELCCEVP